MMKKLLFGLFIAGFFCICVWGITVLNNQEKYFDRNEPPTSMKTDKIYHSINAVRGRIEDVVWLEARIESVQGEPIKVYSIEAEPGDVKIGIGESFQSGDVLLDKGKNSLIAPFSGRVENIIPDKKRY